MPEAEQGWVPTLQAMFREAGIPMIGAIFPALIADSGFVTKGAWLLRFNRMPPWFLLAGTTVAPLDIQLVTAAVRTLLNASQPVRAHDTLFLIFDGMLPQIGTILNWLYHPLPAMEARSARRVVPGRRRRERAAAVAKGPVVPKPRRRYAERIRHAVKPFA